MSTANYSNKLKLTESVAFNFLSFADYVLSYSEDYKFDIYNNIIKTFEVKQPSFSYKKFVSFEFNHEELECLANDLFEILNDKFLKPTNLALSRREIRYLYNKVKDIRNPYHCCECCSYTFDIREESFCPSCSENRQKEDEEYEDSEEEEEQEEEEDLLTPVELLPPPPQEWLDEIELEESQDIDYAKENASYVSSLIKKHFESYSDSLNKLETVAINYVYSCEEDPDSSYNLSDYEFLINVISENDLDEAAEYLNIPESKRYNMIELAKKNAIRFFESNSDSLNKELEVFIRKDFKRTCVNSNDSIIRGCVDNSKKLTIQQKKIVIELYKSRIKSSEAKKLVKTKRHIYRLNYLRQYGGIKKYDILEAIAFERTEDPRLSIDF